MFHKLSQKMFPEDTEHEDKSKERIKTFQSELNSNRTNDAELTRINDGLDAQLKIEDFMMKWREANHAWFKVWAPIFISAVVAMAGFGAGYQAWVAHGLETDKLALETRKVDADIVLKAARDKPEETRTNLEALREAGLLHLTSEDIRRLTPFMPPSPSRP